MGFEDLMNEPEKKEDTQPESFPVVTGSSLVNERPWKILVYGPPGAGKTDYGLGWIPYEINDLGKKPEDVLLCIIDLDDGVAPLLQQGRVKSQYHDRILSWTCHDFKDFLNAYKYFKNVLIEHVNKTGNKGMLFIDNMSQLWEWSREKYTKDSYGMSMEELLVLRRKQALEAGKRILPAFDQMVDYGIINPLHNDPLEDMKFSSNKYFHYIWAAPMKSDYDTKELIPGGQKDNSYRVDYVIKKYTEGTDSNIKFFCDLIKNRGLTKTFVHLENPTFSRFAAAIKSIKEADKKARDDIESSNLIESDDSVSWTPSKKEKSEETHNEENSIILSEDKNEKIEKEEINNQENDDLEW